MKLKQNQSGFSLVSTIFILVVLAVLGSYMALLGTSQSQTTALSVQGVRAWYAAVSGLEWAAFEIQGSGSCPAIPTSMSIEGFTVTVTACSAYSINESGLSYSMHDVTVLSERGSYGEADFVSRTVRATLGGI